ncbi:polysaccharide deacetylase family protein [Sphaerobacter sp.]|uniref:polysaccharide deacetylase family protein n=1 Tax=Sphaerobacter sp. TaxID=2099654 RepID=UPI0025E7006B|nr:polysaccharide deacetylase family protein [Sphaerobacter sp.]
MGVHGEGRKRGLGAGVRRVGRALNALPNRDMMGLGRRLFADVRRIPGVNGVAVTFDDGPGEGLDAFLTTLDRAGVRATFFVVGEQVRAAPGRLTEIVAAGHEVGLHCDRHLHQLSLTPWAVLEDLRRAQATIEDTTGKPVRLYRPPYGCYSLASWFEAGRRGWTRVRWSRDPQDWAADATPDGIVAAVGRPEPGDIILLHDSDRYSVPGAWRRTLAALPRILDAIAAAGLTACPVGALLDQAGIGRGPWSARVGFTPERLYRLG